MSQWVKQRRLAADNDNDNRLVTDRDAGPTQLYNNNDMVHNQTMEQIVHGSQFYGNVTFNNTNPPIHSRQPNLNSTHGETDASSVSTNEILASLAFPRMLDRRENIARPHANTCSWILKLPQYCDWRVQHYGQLWIMGKPGSGKSTLMSFLYHTLRQDRHIEKGVYLDFFFHARGSELQYTPLGMLRCLTNQLLRQCPDTKCAIENSYREKYEAFGGCIERWEWQQFELERLFFDAVILACSTRQVLIFIDALDEAGAEAAQAVANYFYSLNDRVAALHHINSGNSTSCRLKLCLSSRHYPVVSQIRSVQVCMEIHNADDIKAFIRDQVDQLKKATDQLADRDEWDRLAYLMLTHARGVFQWVRLVMRIILNEFQFGWSVRELSKFLQGLPQDLENVYSYIIENTIVRKHISDSFLLFQWLCAEEISLTPKLLMCALDSGSINTSRPIRANFDAERIAKHIRSLSGGLAEVVPSSVLGGIPRELPPPSQLGWDNSVNIAWRPLRPFQSCCQIAEDDDGSDTHEQQDDGKSSYKRVSYYKIGEWDSDDDWSRENAAITENVQVIHQSVREYLVTRGLTLLYQLHKGSNIPLQPASSHIQEDYTARIERCHSTLYWCCLKQLDSPDSQAVIQKLKGISESSEFIKGRSFRLDLLTTSPFVYYAAVNIFKHAKKASSHRSIDPMLHTDSPDEIARLGRIWPYWLICFERFSERTYPEWSLLHIADVHFPTDLFVQAVNATQVFASLYRRERKMQQLFPANNNHKIRAVIHAADRRAKSSTSSLFAAL